MTDFLASAKDVQREWRLEAQGKTESDQRFYKRVEREIVTWLILTVSSEFTERTQKNKATAV